VSKSSRSHALVIGASTTIGVEYARQLAARGYGLVVVARRAELLESLATEIRGEHGVPVRVLALDLLEDDAVGRLVERTADLEIGFLVCNANLHRVGYFADMDLETKLRMLRMNAELPMRLADAYGPGMVERRRGSIVFVNALNCLTPLDFDGVFQGTKSFLLVFAESLWAEYRRHEVSVGVAMISGIEGSESYERKLSPLKRRLIKWAGASMPPERIVHQSLEQLDRGESILVPDVALPVNLIGYRMSAAARATRSQGVTRAMSNLYRWLLDGDESKAAGVHGSSGEAAHAPAQSDPDRAPAAGSGEVCEEAPRPVVVAATGADPTPAAREDTGDASRLSA
jgi:hypothetical protein